VSSLAREFRRTVRGMRDLVADEAESLRFIEQKTREVSKLYGYEEVITPLVEHYELLAAKLGEDNRKRMYVFEDLGGRKVALRPEFTASIARLVATKMRSVPRPLRLFSVGSLYRYDEPQFGRFREFWQANYELFGSNKPEADAEILALTANLMRDIDLRDYSFKVGHVGVLRGILNQEGIAEDQQNKIMELLDKKQWDGALEEARKSGASTDCMETLSSLFEVKGRKPVSVAERMSEVAKGCSEAEAAAANLGEIFTLFEASGLETDVVVEARFARGLEYYTGMIFEIYAPGLDIALGGGGRYDKLIELFGGGRVPAVGVAPGLDRLLLALQNRGQGSRMYEGPKILVIPVDGSMLGKALEVSSMLRREGLPVELETMRRSVKKALADADRRGNTHAVIVGPKEIKDGKVVLRQMKNRTQDIVALNQVSRKLRKQVLG
jgi:histidyl-tRNA synthetase